MRLRAKPYEPPPACRPITMTYRPSLGFLLTSTAATRREWVKYIRLRNYKERLGHPIRHIGPPTIVMELDALRARIARLEDDRRLWKVGLRATMQQIIDTAKKADT